MQAGSAFYLAVCPMKIIPKIFVFDEDEVPPELRAQRTLNRQRIPEIAEYLSENKHSYVVSALTASIDASVEFEPDVGKGVDGMTGTLHIPMDARILINDGQHRRAAIEEAIKDNPDLKEDHVPVLFFVDRGLKRSQQMFADLNKHAIRPSDSLGTLYDQRDPSSELARYIAFSVEAFKGLTEMEKSSISNRSSKLFTLSGIKHASRALLRKSRNQPITQEEMELAAAFWGEVAANISDWKSAKQRKVACSDLRQNAIHAHGVTLLALGMVGAELLAKHPKDWRKKLTKLQSIDWSRSNHDLWEGRAMVMGRMNKSRHHVVLTANLIKRQLGLQLTPDEESLERQLDAA
jgi:DNA sulfur modification protein DndB